MKHQVGDEFRHYLAVGEYVRGTIVKVIPAEDSSSGVTLYKIRWEDGEHNFVDNATLEELLNADSFMNPS